MTKRLFLHANYETLPKEIILIIGNYLQNEYMQTKEKKLYRHFVSFARLNHENMKIFGKRLDNLKTILWCIICNERENEIAWACSAGANCEYYIILQDRHHRFKKSDGLCIECCMVQCDFCKKGCCGCDCDYNSCNECQREICSYCQCMYFNYEDNLCDSCFDKRDSV